MKKHSMNLMVLVLFMTGAIDSIRNLPSTAIFGAVLIFFFLIGALLFLIPTGLVAAELSATFHEEGGIYAWVKKAFGEKTGVLAIWLQWINTALWYPTILSFTAGTLVYLWDPALGNNKLYLCSMVIGIFWLITFINIKGLKISAGFSALCSFIGTVIPMATILILGIIWLIEKQPSHLQVTASNIFPNFHSTGDWVSLTGIMAAFLGMELTSVHVGNVKNAQKTFPKALLISIIFILITMVGGSVAIAMILPSSQISLVNGSMQAFQNFFALYHVSFLIPIFVVMIVIGNIGSIINWAISPAKGLVHAAKNGYLPALFATENEAGVNAPVLIAQACINTVVCLAFVLMPSVNGAYWLLTDLSTELYLGMYVLMFIAGIIIKYKFAHHQSGFKIPGGKAGMWFVAVAGLLGCTISIIVGFFPPSGINVGTGFHYVMTFSLGLVLMVLPVLGLFAYKRLA
jgi:amino acid transporter